MLKRLAVVVHAFHLRDRWISASTYSLVYITSCRLARSYIVRSCIQNKITERKANGKGKREEIGKTDNDH